MQFLIDKHRYIQFFMQVQQLGVLPFVILMKFIFIFFNFFRLFFALPTC